MQRPGEFSTIEVGALCAVSPLTWLSVCGLPYEVSLLAKDYRLDSASAGAVASVEMLTLAAVVALGSGAFAGGNKRHFAMTGVAIAILGSVASIVGSGLTALVFARVLFGAGVGLIAISCNALPAAHARPERLFAYMQMATGVMFVVLMFIQPVVDDAVPRSGLFVTQLACLLLLGTAGMLLPIAASSSATDRPRAAGPGLPLVLVLGALAVFCVVEGGAWGFVAQAGAHMGLSSTSIGWALTGSAVAGNIGPVAAAILALRLGYAKPILSGFVLLAVCIGLIYFTGRPIAYVVGVLILNAVPPFLNPYSFGLLAARDGTGVSASLGGAAVNVGLGAGPLICGYLAEVLAAVDFTIVLIGLTGVAGMCMAIALLMLHRGHPLTAAAPEGIRLEAFGPDASET